MKFDPKLDKEVLVGCCTPEALQDNEFGLHYQTEYGAYEVNMEVIPSIKDKYQNTRLTIIMGTWCHDSQIQVPRFFKVMDQAGISHRSVEVICVDGEKKVEDMDFSELNIELVPTFIFYKGRKEIGRIIETPILSLEEDLLQILIKTE